MTDHSEDIIFKKRIEAYYRGERVSNATLVVAGVIAIIWTSFLFYWRQGHLSGAFFYSALPLSLFYILTGGYRFIRTISRYGKSISDNHDTFLKADEIPHIELRINKFKKKRTTDMIAFLIAFFMCIVAVMGKYNHLYLGTAATVTVFSAILLVFDLFGQFRAEEYIHFLHKRYS